MIKTKFHFFLLISLLFLSGYANAAALDSLLNEDVEDTIKVNVLNSIAWDIRFDSSYQSIRYANNAIKLAQPSEFTKGIAKSFYIKGDAFRGLQKIDSSVANYLQAIEIYQLSGERGELSGCYNNIGIMYEYGGDYVKALNYYQKSHTVNVALGLDSWMAVSLNNIAGVHEYMGNYKDAIGYYTKSIKLKQKVGSKKGVANGYNNLGLVFEAMGDYGTAEDYYNKSLSIKSKIGNKQGMANTYNNLGELYQTQGKYTKAIDFLFKSVKIQEEINDEFGLAASYLNIGTLYIKLELYPLAIKYLRQCNNIANRVKSAKEIMNSYKLLSDCYDRNKNTQKALFYLRLYDATKDSILNIESNRTIAELEARFSDDYKYQKINLLEKKNDLQKENIEKEKMIIAIVIGAMLLLIVLVIALIINIKRRILINDELRDKIKEETKQKEEKEVLLKEVHHRVKNNLQIINSLLRLQSYQIEDESIKELFSECQNRVLSIALIHEKLYQSKNFAEINVENYVHELTDNLIATYNTITKVSVDVKTNVSTFNIDTIISFGLILNEVISNALKHGLKDMETGEIRVHLTKRPDSTFELIVGDNGHGMERITFDDEELDSLGVELIKTLTGQIDGEVELLPDKGTYYRIVFLDRERN